MINSLTEAPKLHSRLVSWTTPMLFFLTLCALASHQMRLSGLTERLADKADAINLQRLTDRVAALEAHRSMVPQTQNGVGYSELNQLNDSFNDRIIELSSAITGAASQTDLEALQQRVQQLEVKPNVPSVPPTPKIKRPARPPQAAVTPDIQVLGQELRGGERFLSVSPLNAESLDQCGLIRIGESYAGFRLDAIEQETAVFSANGQTHRLHIR